MIVALGSVFKPTVAVVGAHGGLGRELVSQCIEREWNVRACVCRPASPLYEPSRNGWLSEGTQSTREMVSEYLSVEDVSDSTPVSCRRALRGTDAVVFALGGKPFQPDTTTELVMKMCESLPRSCRSVCLVSAYGVADSLRGANAGIQLMSSWYLADTYRQKGRQEGIVNALKGRSVRVIRPRVLSYGEIPLNPVAVPRQRLAADILNWVTKS